jgi:hypothetical protein
VVLDTGRALVRLFEHSLIEGSEEALAATAAELLGTAYLFEPDKTEGSRPIEALVETTREQAGITEGAPATRNRARFRAGVILQDQPGRYDEAIAMFEGYLKETSDRRANAAEARMRLAKSFQQKGDSNDTSECCGRW